MFKQLGLIGCGLIGGSFALALKKAGLVERVCGYSATEQTTKLAKDLGVIDTHCMDASSAVRGSDIVLIAIPVQAVESCLREIAPYIEQGCLVMDVGSTKENIAQAALAFLGNKLPQFVPTHPIAGKELTGVAQANAELFQNRPLILTPLLITQEDLVEKAKQVWTRLGSKVHRMSPQAHDAAFAVVSHLPHLIAFAYMNGLVKQHEHEQFMSVAGPGFRDFSRIAGSDPKVWRDIFFANGSNLKQQIALFKTELEAMERLVETKDSAALIKSIEISQRARNEWSINN
jgi:prephenate dehydrogenase